MTYPTDGVFSNEHALEWLTQIVVLNSRLFLLLAVCLLLVHYFKGSAAKRHLIIVSAFLAAAALPLSTQWIPAIEFVIEVNRPFSTVEPFNISNNVPIISATSQQAQYLNLYLLFLYVSISAFFIFRIVRSNLAILRLITYSSSHSLSQWQRSLNECTTILKIQQNIEIRHNGIISSPLTWGFGTSVILIPSSALNWSDEMRRSALLHELAHIKRRDCLSKQLARFLCALYWINPLCWIALRQFSHYAESASDDMALNSGIKLSQYAENLLHVAKQVNRPQTHWSLAALSMVGMPLPRKKGNGNNQLSLRVSAILNPNGCRAPINWICLSLTFFLVFGLLLPLSSLKASVVQKITYVVTNPRQVIPFQTPPRPSQARPVIESDINLESLNNKLEQQLQYQQDLKQLVQSSPVVPPKPEFIEVPVSVVIEQAKNKVQYTLSNLASKQEKNSGKNNESITTASSSVSTPTFSTQNDEIDEVKAIDLAAIMNTHQAIDHLKTASYLENRDLALNPVETKIEPFIAEQVVTPTYPRRAQSRGIEGELLVEFDIDSRGNVTAAKIINAQPSGVFDRAVLNAVQQNRYTPQKIDGKAVTVSGVQEKYVFVLES